MKTHPATIHHDFVKSHDLRGRRLYTPKLIGNRISLRTFSRARDARDYRHECLARYWGMKSQIDTDRESDEWMMYGTLSDPDG